MKHGRLFGVWTLLVLWLALPFGVSAEPVQQVSRDRSSFEQAEASVAKIVKSDPDVKDLLAWERAATRLQRYTADYPSSKNLPNAYLRLAQIYERMFKKRKFRSGLSKAVYYYERLAQDYQGDTRVPEALLALGDLRRTELQDEPAARSAYFELVDVYPKSTLVAKAKARLGLEDGPPVVTKEESSASAASSTAASRSSAPAVMPPSEGKEVFSSANSISRPLIVIDPGHGGLENGALGVDGVLEKDVVLNVAKYLSELLRERLRARTILTRTDDRTMSLAERTELANAKGADLFVSVHANASEYKNVKGIEVYYLDNTNDKSSLKLAQRENASHQEANTDLGFIISDFIQNAKLDESISLAHHLQSSLVAGLARYYEEVKDLGVKKAPFYVLVGAHMPCVLAEISFIDNPTEGARLITARYQHLVALGLYQGIKDYFEQRGK